MTGADSTDELVVAGDMCRCDQEIERSRLADSTAEDCKLNGFPNCLECTTVQIDFVFCFYFFSYTLLRLMLNANGQAPGPGRLSYTKLGKIRWKRPWILAAIT